MANERLFIGHSNGNRIKLGKRFGEWTCEPYESKTFPLMSEDEFEEKCKVIK